MQDGLPDPFAELAAERMARAAAEAEIRRLQQELAEAIESRQRERDAGEVRIRQITVLAHEWWVKADKAIREVAWLRATWSWRLTSPFRVIGRLPRSIRKRYRRARGLPPLPVRARGPREPGLIPALRRFAARLGRSINKRYRRLMGLTPPAAPVRSSAAPLAPVSAADLSRSAQILFRRMTERRNPVARPTSAEEA